VERISGSNANGRQKEKSTYTGLVRETREKKIGGGERTVIGVPACGGGEDWAAHWIYYTLGVSTDGGKPKDIGLLSEKPTFFGARSQGPSFQRQRLDLARGECR